MNTYENFLNKYKETSKQIIVSRRILKKIIKTCPNDADLNFLDVSNITNMSHLFICSNFNGDISNWDVSNVNNMSFMFSCSHFNNDISKWNINNVRNMFAMFEKSSFNSDISNWNVSNVQRIGFIFYDCHIKDSYKPKFK